MKKVIKILMSITLCFAMCLSLTGCGEIQIKGLYLKEGTLEERVERGKELDTSNLTIIVEYSDGTHKEVSGEDLDIGVIDTAETGDKQLQVTYEDESITIPIHVYTPEADVNIITSFSSNLLTEHKLNSSTKENEEEEFVDKDQPFFVGSENPLDFRINAKGISPEGELVENLEKVRTEIKLEKGEQTGEEWQFTQLSDEEVDEIASLDTENTRIQFKEGAIGNTYKITIKAVNFDTDYGNNDSFTGVFKVIRGYNIYSVKDLYLIDNDEENGHDWETFRQRHGLPKKNYDTFILQSSINITAQDVPENKFWSQDEVSHLEPIIANKTNQPIVGSVHDSNDGIYVRRLGNDENFHLYGNYFSMSCTDFPRGVVNWYAERTELSNRTTLVSGVWVANDPDEPSATVNMHCPLFGFWPTKTAEQEHKGHVIFQDVYFIGNGGRSSNPINSGGLLLAKTSEVSFKAQNTIHRDFFVGYFTQAGKYKIESEHITDEDMPVINEGDPEYNAKIEIIDSKGYNDYSCLLYFYGEPNSYVEGGEFKGAGGPAIIADHETDSLSYIKDTGEGGNTTNLVVVGTILESFVTGQEPWFVSYKASGLIAQLLATNAIFTNINKLTGQYSSTNVKSFLTDRSGKSMMNLKFLMKCGVADASGSEITRGSALIFDTMEDYEAYKESKKLADGSLYYGYDRNKAYVDVSGTKVYMYTNPTAQGNDFGAKQHPAELLRFEASSSGLNIIPTDQQVPAQFYSHSDIQTQLNMTENGEQVYQDLMSSKYLNIYLSNGFGGIIDLYDYSSPSV